jgi:hypothetical protein
MFLLAIQSVDAKKTYMLKRSFQVFVLPYNPLPVEAGFQPFILESLVNINTTMQ